jgi:hypothetical protein
MDEQASEASVAEAFEQAFGSGEAAPEPVAPAQGPLDEVVADGEVELELEAEAEAEEEAPAEPEFEIEIDGARETIRGADKVKELLARGLKSGRLSEENARVRDSLIAQAKFQQDQASFQQAAMDDITALRSMDAQLEQWGKVDWAAAFESDPFHAMKLKEQRDQLRETRNSKFNEFSRKHQDFQSSQQQVVRAKVQSEEAALLAKVPEWRNAEKALPEKQAIVRDLGSHYGFNSEEIQSIVDHRMLLVARDAVKYRELVRNKDQRVQQVRTAPPVSKPGTVAKTNGKVELTKARQTLRELGQRGNHKAQEALVEQMFSKAFK